MSSTPSKTPRVFALAMLNDTLDDTLLIPFLDAAKAAGYDGVCPHPRDGLRVPYGSRTFWKGIDRFFELSIERGLEIWHYDEFPFPSGMAGGLVPEDFPDCGVRSLRFEKIEGKPNRDGVLDVGSGRLLALLRYELDENNRPKNVRDVTEDSGAYLDTWAWGEWHNRYYTGTINIHEELHERGHADRFVRAYLPDLPLENNERLMAIKVRADVGRRGQAVKPDISRVEVTDRFLKIAYAPLAALSRKYHLGATPVFQDEVTFGTEWPWNEPIENALREKWGTEFSSRLFSLHAPDENDANSNWESARMQYRAACCDALETGWFARVENWCHENGLRTTGHLPGEESILGHCQFMGNAWKMLRHFDVPGYDIISSTIADDLNRGQAIGAKVVQSAAWADGRKPTMVEVFGANGFHNDVQKNRSVLAWLACHDLTRVFDHSAYTSAVSLRKYDAPPVSTRFNPMHAGRADLWQWQHWIADLFDEYSFVPSTLVLFPIESFARYCLGETEQWREQGSLLETWFHYLFAASLDALFVPSHLLNEVAVDENGFHFGGRTFKNFVVPPVVSLHEATFQTLEKFQAHSGFSWCAPRALQGTNPYEIKIFNEKNATRKAVTAPRLFTCDETELLEQKAAWFDGVLASPLSGIRADRTLLKTARTSAQGETILILINPHEEPLRVAFSQAPGELISQPPHEIPLYEIATDKNGAREVLIAPRDILIFRSGAARESSFEIPQTETPQTQITSRAEIQPTSTQVRFVASNHFSLKRGVAKLEGFEDCGWQPAPVSSLWKLPVEYAETEAVYALPYSRENLAAPSNFQAEFEIEVETALEILSVVIDEESLPPHTRVMWDGVLLEKQTRDVFDGGNTVFPIPASHLKTGAHRLVFESEVSHASHGVLERPILSGDFLVSAAGALRPVSREWQDWNGEAWPELGIPEGFGPVEYAMSFDIDEDAAGKSWQLQFSPFIGVAEVFVNDECAGRSSWEPRVLPMRDLKAGENRVLARLHGSWNNVFSNLNRLENGWHNAPTLLETAPFQPDPLLT